MPQEFTQSQKYLLRFLLNCGQASNKLIAQSFHISNACISLKIKPLFERNVLTRTQKIKNGKVGRNEEMIGLNPNYLTFLGVEELHDGYQLCACNFCGQLLASKKVQTADEIEEFLLPFRSSETPIGAIGILELEDSHNKELDAIASSYSCPVYRSLSIEAKALIYRQHNPLIWNFMVVQYDKSLSSVVVFGENLAERSAGNIGNILLREGITLKELAYSCTDAEKLKTALPILVTAMINAQGALQLDKILLSGSRLEKDHILEMVNKEARRLKPDFNEDVLEKYADESPAEALAAMYGLVKSLA